MRIFLAALLVLAAAGCPSKNKRTGAGSASGSAKKKRIPDIPENGALAQRVLYGQAKSLLLKGKSAEAAAAFRRAIAAHGKGPLLASAWLGLGSALGDMKRYKDAVAAYREVVKLRPADPEGYKALAIGLTDAGDVVHARAALEKALALDPDALATYQDLAGLHLRENDQAGAKAVYARYEKRRKALVALAGDAAKAKRERLSALGRLAGARDERTARWLASALPEAKDDKIKVAMIVALQGQGLKVGIEALDAAAKGGSAEVKRAALLAMQALSAAPAPSGAGVAMSGTGAGTGSGTGTGAGTGTGTGQ
ncbi:MAG: tetratricopeptide repeat protein [Myxococcales bacterium]|nr:tetratricopeptide repeat protein [Myxococcales bacterium]